MRIPFSVSFKLRFKHGAKRRVKKSTSLGLVSIVILSLALPILGFILPNQSPVQAASDWWNEDWTYRQSINLNSPTTQTNVYHQLQLDTSNTSKFNTDCSDLRFTSNTGQQIPHHLVSGCGTSNTQIQLLFSELPGGDQDIIVYYGNLHATSTGIDQPFNNPASGITTTLQPEQTSPAPIAHWKFDEGYGTTANSSTSQNYSGTLTNGPTWQQEDMCPSGKCLYFDGQNDQIRAGFSESFNFTRLSPFTISAWVRPLDGLGINERYIVSRFSLTGDVGGYVLFHKGNKIYFDLIQNTGSQQYIVADLPDNTSWHHIVGTYDGSGNRNGISLYINGQMTAKLSSGLMGEITSNNQLVLGSGSANNGPFRGGIDETKIYNYARTQQQIQQDYVRGIQSMQAQQANLSNGLVGRYSFEEGSGSSIIDHSGSNHAATWITPTDQYRVGKYGSGGSFLSGSTNANTADSNDWKFSTSGGSASFWFKADPAQTATYATILHHYSNPSGWTIFMSTTGVVRLITGTSTGQLTVSTPTSYNDNNWHHFVAIIDPNKNEITLAIDGQKVVSQSYSGTILDGTKALEIGGRSLPDYQFKGMLDEMRIYKRILNTNEITKLYNSAPKPIAYYDFEEGAGGIAYDKSSHGNNGSWSGTGDRYSQGGAGKAGFFNGIDDKVTTNYKHDYANGVTMGAWFKTAGSTGMQAIFSNGGANSNSVGSIVRIDPNGHLRFESSKGTLMEWNVNLFPQQQVDDNKWHYTAAVWDGSTEANAVKLYLDGVLVANGTALSSVSSSSGNLVIGGYNDGASMFFKGSLDELKLYNYARTPNQILQDMQSSTPNKLNVVGQWNFDNDQQDSVIDSSFRKNNGTMSSPGCAYQSSGLRGNSIGCADQQQVTIPYDTAYSSPTFTLSAWIKVDQLNTGTGDSRWANGLISMQQYSVAGWRMGISSSGKIAVWTNENGGNISMLSRKSINNGQWRHIALSYDGSAITIFIDGSIDSIVAGTYIPPQAQIIVNTQHGGGGAGSNSAYDEIKFYNTALTPQQITIDYNQSSVAVIGSTSTQPTISATGQSTTQPTNSQDATYCVPGSADYCAKPVGEYKFEDPTNLSTIIDSSGNENNGAALGSFNQTNFQPGKYGKALKFDGVNDYVNLGPILAGADSYTLTYWFKATEYATVDKEFQGLVGESNQPRTTWRSDKVIDGGLAYETGGWAGGVSTPELQLNKWYDITLVVQESSTNTPSAKMYVDGQLVDTHSWSQAVRRPTGSIFLGQRDGRQYFSGMLDGVRIYNYARTPAQVAWDYNNGKPIAHYKLDECSGTTVHDSSGNNFVGSLNLGIAGITAPGTCSSANTAWSLGKMGKRNTSMSFDGVDDYVQVNNEQPFRFTDTTFTATGWFKSAGYGFILAKGGGGYGGSYQGWGVSLQTSGGVQVMLKDTGNSQPVESSSKSSNFNDNQWHHFVAIITTSTTTPTDNSIILYLDGKRDQGSINRNGNTYSPGNAPMQIGKRISGSFFPGLIDDLQIYNYALTQKQIDALYNSGAVRWGP